MMDWNPEIETSFQNWIRKTPWWSQFANTFGEQPNINSPDYNYRLAYLRGIQPVLTPDRSYHWSSKTPEGEWLKNPETHETAWMQKFMDLTGKDPNELFDKESLPAMIAKMLLRYK